MAEIEEKEISTTEKDTDLPIPDILPVLPLKDVVVFPFIIHAAQAVGEASWKGQGRGRITISTRKEGDWLEMRIGDTATEVPPALWDKVTSHAGSIAQSTTDPGQWLAAAHTLVVQKHKGTLTIVPQERGTVFVIRLPTTTI